MRIRMSDIAQYCRIMRKLMRISASAWPSLVGRLGGYGGKLGRVGRWSAGRGGLGQVLFCLVGRVLNSIP